MASASIDVCCVLVRALSPQFGACIRQDRSVAIDLERARQQHDDYVTALGSVVGAVVEVGDAAAHPDGVFVEDTVVMFDESAALLTRSGAPSRREELGAVATTLSARGVELTDLRAPATLDGGDVLRIGGHLVVGRSPRTNAAGIEALARAARSHGIVTESVPIGWGLHLKSGCSLADERTLLYYPHPSLDIAPFAALGMDCLAVDEPLGANVLALGHGRVLVSSASPRAATVLADRGLDVTVLDVSELHKADGALTCPSVRLPARGSWCT